MVRRISIRPFGSGWWSFNPSLHHDRTDGAWRCVFRCANYSLPDGIPQLSPDARGGRAATRNVIALLDPVTLAILGMREMRELDQRPRARGCPSLGYEDLRLFRTARDGLCAVATALHLNLERPSCPEVVLCHLDPRLDIVDASPLRGPWSAGPQKNWSPFDGTAEPRLLYSIERGVVMSDRGPVRGSPICQVPRRPSGAVVRSIGRCGVEVKVMGGRPDAHHPPAAPAAPGSTELRGGSQLIEIGGDRWLGVAHEMRLRQPHRRKFYWHTLYVVDGEGRLFERSPPFKLSASHGIEFAAGIAMDDRGGIAISYGTDDHDSWIAITTLEAVTRVLRPIDLDVDAGPHSGATPMLAPGPRAAEAGRAATTAQGGRP